MGTPGGTPRLLVVDDEPFNLEIISEYFEGTGLDLDTAENGELAWSLLNGDNNYSAVLLDRMMPVLDGMALLKRMKSDSRFLSISPSSCRQQPAVPDQVREGLAAGAYYYLVKPYARDSLLTIVRGALADNGGRLELQQKLGGARQRAANMARCQFGFRAIEEASILAAFLAQICPQPESAVLGLSELMINGVEHGNLGISYAEKSELGEMIVGRGSRACDGSLPENSQKRVRARLLARLIARASASLTKATGSNGRNIWISIRSVHSTPTDGELR